MKTRWLAIMYVYPSVGAQEWRLLFSLRNVHAVVINPNNGYKRGSLTGDDLTNWTRVIRQCSRRGMIPLGYISTRWGDRPINEMLDEMYSYERDFHITSFFLDETPTALDKIENYETMRKAVPGMLVLNPGAPPAMRYFELGDIIVVRETSTPADEPTEQELKRGDHCCHIMTGYDVVATLEHFQKFPDIGYRWFTPSQGDYTKMPDFVRLLDTQVL